jgi:membrane-associated phospholipid phosphatase
MSASPVHLDDGPSRGDQAKGLFGLFVGAYVVLTAIWFLLGRALLASNRIVDGDQNVAERFASGRTERMNDLTFWGSMLADTLVKIVATAAIAAIMVAVWRRWRDALMVVLPLVLEASVFITVTWLIGRPRPDVERLEGSPVNSSFPSGHVAAAAAYGAVVVVVFWHTTKTWIRAASVALVAAIVFAVGWSRMYRGMHFLTDVLAGIALGVASVAVAWWILRRLGLSGSPEEVVQPERSVESAVYADAAVTGDVVAEVVR